MSCTIDSKVLRSVLKAALSENFSKYRLLSNTVQDVLALNNITDEAKAKILVAYTELYKSLAQKSTRFETGPLGVFLEADVYPLVADNTMGAERFTDALNLVREKLSIQPAEESVEDTLIESLQDEIDGILEGPAVGRYGKMVEAVNKVVNNRSLIDEGLENVKDEELNSVAILQNAIDAIKRDKNILANTKKQLQKVLEDGLYRLRSANAESSYVDITTMEDLFLNRFEAFKKDGSVVDLVEEDGVFYVTNVAGEKTGEVFDTSEVKPKKVAARDKPSWMSNDGERIFLDANEITTGLVLVGEEVSEFKSDLLQSSSSPVNSMRIVVDTTNAERHAERMSIIESKSQEFPALANRTIETRETRAQINVLKAGKPILTRGRLSDTFSIRLMSPSGKTVTLQSMNDYVFVYPDNSTVRVDFENDDHLRQFLALTEIRQNQFVPGQLITTSTNRPTTLADLQVLRAGARRYKEFAEEVQKLIEAGELEIPASLFNKYFDFQNVVYNVNFKVESFRDRTPDVKLSDFIAKHSGGLKVTVVNTNNPNNPEQREIPAIFVPIDSIPGAPWVPVDTLDQDEYILRDGKRYKWAEYVETFHGAEMKQQRDAMTKLNGIKYVMLNQSTKGNFAIVPLIGVRNTFSTESIADMFLSLRVFRDNFDKSTSGPTYGIDFNNNHWGFDITNNIQAEFITNKAKDTGKPYLGITFTAKEGSAQLEEFNAVAKELTIAFNDGFINDATNLIKAFFVKNNLDFNLENQNDVQKIRETLGALFSNPNMSVETLEFKNKLGNLQKKFTETLYDRFIKRLEAIKAKSPEAAEAIASVPDFEYLMFEKQSNAPVMRIADRELRNRISEKLYTMKAQAVNALSLRWNLPSAFEGNQSVIDKAETIQAPLRMFGNPETIKSEEPINPTHTPPTEGSSADDLEDADPFGDGAFSLDNPLERAAFEEGEFKRQVDYIKERLPEGIKVDDLEKIIKNLDAHGNVLGYIKDKVIYLSEQLSRPGTGYHEAFHAVFRYLMTPEERMELLNREFQLMGTVSNKSITDFRAERGGLAHLSNMDVISLMAEERMADKFKAFATKATAPQTWYAKLFNLIKNMIEFFTKHGNEIDKAFARIHTGYYKNAQVKEFNGLEGAYELIKTLPTYNNSNGKVASFYDSMNAQDMMNLRNILVNEMLTNKTVAAMSASERYDAIAKSLIDYYTIERHIETAPYNEQQIRQYFEKSMRDYRYVLGAVNTGEVFPVVNLSGDPAYDNRFINKQTTGVGKTNAAKSYNQMKKMVLEVYDSLYVVANTVEDQASQDMAEGMDLSESTDRLQAAQSDQEELGNRAGDVPLLEAGTSEGDREFRKIFQFLTYEDYHAPTGLTIRKAVNADMIFDAIKKITANVPVTEILPRLQNAIAQLKDDLSTYDRLWDKFEGVPESYESTNELYQSLNAVMNMLERVSGVTQNQPTRNVGMFNQFHSVFHVSAGVIAKVTLETAIDQSSEELVTETKVDDMVQSQDNRAAMDRLMENYTFKYSLLPTEKKTELVRELQKLNMQIFSKMSGQNEDGNFFTNYSVKEDWYMQDGVFSDAKLNKMTDDMFVVLSNAKLGLPRHFIKFSLAAMIQKEGTGVPKGTEAFNLLLNNKSLLKEGAYLNGNAFEKLYNMLRHEFTPVGKTSVLFQDTDSKKSRQIYASLINAMTYITKFDPTVGQPVVMNTTGKKIYRFTNYSPMTLVMQDIESKGLMNFVNEVYGPQFVQWFQDNAMLFGSTEAELLVNNLQVGYLNGISQRIREADSNNTDITDIDLRGYHIANLAMFGKRNLLRSGKTRMQVFNRITSQNDSTGTVYTVTAAYQRYAGKKGTFTLASTDYKNSGKVSVISAKLADLINQEYNRIGREWSTRNEGKILYSNYNGKLTKDGTARDTSDPTLRAYNFNQLSDFFKGNELRENFRDMLTDAAKQGIPFEDAITAPGMEAFFRQLDEYANDEHEFFKQTIKDAGIIQEEVGKISSDYISREYNVNGNAVSLADDNHDLNTYLLDYFFNDWINRLFVNQLFDGDFAVGIGDAISYYKRLKSQAAAGSNAEAANVAIQHGTINYRHAVFTIAGEKEMPVYFDNSDLTVPQTHDKNQIAEGQRQKFEILDGHVFQSLEHRMKFLSTEGKLDVESERIIRSMRFRKANSEEIQYLLNRGIQLNPQKTVTAHPIHYLKMSEHYINRFDVSYYKGTSSKEAVEKLAALYAQADLYYGQLEKNIQVNEEGQNIEELYQQTIRDIQGEFLPIRGKEMLHNLLNTMEYHRLGQILDNTASKRGTVVPTVVSIEDLSSDDFVIDVTNSIASIPLRYTFNQVATESHGHDVTDSIQPKLLLDTDLSLDDPEIPENTKDEVRRYRKILEQIATASRHKFERMVMKDGSVDIAQFYRVIQEGLQRQGAPAHILKLWDVVDGKPVHSANLPGMSERLKYNVFSSANAMLFQPKAPGFKFFHGSSFGHQVIVDENDQVVPHQIVRRNPRKFANYKTRYPSFRKETDASGNDRYVVEVLIPKPLEDNDLRLQVIEKSLSEFFGTRIPTEDKRSMVVAKVVGFIDSSYMNTIVVPEQVHHLSGSDKDIDSLYARMLGTYENAMGELHLYGDYSGYEKRYGMGKETAQFIEYLHYMMQDQFFGPLVNHELRKIKQDPEYKVENLKESAALFGPKVQGFFNQSLDELTKQIENKFKDVSSSAPGKGNADATLAEKGDVVSQSGALEDVQLQRTLKMMEKMIAVMNVLGTSAMPKTPEQLVTYLKSNGSPVIPILQNEYLDSSMKLLSDPYVYENLYSKEYSNADSYKEAVTLAGIREEDSIGQSNFQTITSVATTRDKNQGAKDGVGIFASFNKGLSIAVKHDLSLQNPIWNINNHVYKYFGKDPEQPKTTRAHSHVGNSLGMSADAAKNPYPAMLGMNEYNMGVTAYMQSLGIDPVLSVYLNLIPSVKAVNDKYSQESDSSVKTNNKSIISFSNHLEKELSNLISRLVEDKEFEAYPGLLDKELNRFDLSKIGILFDRANVDAEDIKSNEPSVAGFGIDVEYNGETNLTEKLKQALLLQMFAMQHQSAEKMRFMLTPLTDPQKSLAPSFGTIDRLKQAFMTARDKGAEEYDGMDRVFEQSPVYRQLMQNVMLFDALTQSMFLDRNPIVKQLVNELKSSVFLATEDKIGGIITSFLGMQVLRKNIAKALSNPEMETKNPVAYNRFKTFESMLKADFWFSDEMSTDIQSLKNQFPGNAFLDAIRPHMIQVKTESGKKNTMRVIRSRSKAKVSSEREEMIINGLDALLMNPDQEVKEKAYKLFYYSIIKDGLNNAPYSLRRYLNPDYFREISTGMKEIESSFKELIDKPLIDETEFAKMFTTMLQSVTGSSASLQTLINKVISQMNPEAKAEKVNVISFDERGKFKDANKNTQETFVAALKSIRSDMSLVSKENKERKHPTLVKEGKPVARKFRKGKSSYDLFLPGAGNSFEINFPQIEDAKVRSLRDDILVQMKMFPTRSNGERVWKCPLFVTNSYGEIMILNSIDGVPITERLTNKVYNKAFNTSDEEQLYTNAFVATGSATYVKMELQGNPQISSIAFDEQEAVRLNELYYGEKDAVVTEPVAVKTEENSAPVEESLQVSTTLDEVIKSKEEQSKDCNKGNK